jgi:hypothetical protein
MHIAFFRHKLIVVLAIAVVWAIGAPCYGYDVTVADDFSYPQQDDYDYGLESSDIEFSIDHPLPGNTVTITAHVQNYGICIAHSGYGSSSANGRSCWGEWDFDYPSTDTVDITFRCYDDDSNVKWRIELDGVHLADKIVPHTAGGSHLKLVTIHDVPIDSGSHTVFLGTYNQSGIPDYYLDWIEIGDLHIEAETYDRTGGNDVEPDFQGLKIIPMAANPPQHRNIQVQIWDGDPDVDGTLICEDFVGDTNRVADNSHEYPGTDFVAHYIKDNDEGILECEWDFASCQTNDIYVVVDCHEKLTEIDETNNKASRVIPVGALCGDANGDCQINVGDAVALINYIFKGGAAPVPICRGDASNDGAVNVADAVFLVSYIFRGGMAPEEYCCYWK